jgi:hypothetical protein
MSTNILFMGGIEEFLTGSSKIVVPIARNGGPAAVSYMATDLDNAAHLTKGPSSHATLFRPTSAIVLLACIDPDKSHIMGILHPDPEYALPHDVFPQVPFARVFAVRFAASGNAVALAV